MNGRRQGRGRPAKPVKGPDGKEVIGLSFNKGTGDYYATGTRPRVKFGKEYLPAIKKFRMWEAEQGGKKVTFVEESPDGVYTESTGPLTLKFHHVPDELFLAMLAEWLADPVKCRRAAQATGYPLDRLETLPAPSKPITLKQAVQNYLNKRKPISDGEKKQVQLAWNNFSEAMQVGTLQAVTQDAVEQWAEGLFETHSVKFAKNRIRRIITVVRYNLKKRKDETGCKRILDYIGTIETPSDVLLNPKPISREDFHKLLNAARGSIWEAFLLVGLNCCYYGIDLVRLPISAVQLEKRTIVFAREKTNIPRVAVLWERTAKALEGLLKGRENRKWVFENYQKTHWSSLGFCNGFDKLRGRAGFYSFLQVAAARQRLKDGLITAKELETVESEMAQRPKIEFSQIRDGAYTAACGAGIPEKEAKILAGHRISGETDAYVMRNPQMVQHACDAIERHYFPSKSQ